MVCWGYLSVDIRFPEFKSYHNCSANSLGCDHCDENTYSNHQNFKTRGRLNYPADESVDWQIVERLRQDGHQVWYVAEMESGISDENVLDLVNKERHLLITADKDFGELVFLQRRLSQVLFLSV